MRCVAMPIDMGSGSTCFTHESFPIEHSLMAVSAHVRGVRIVVISMHAICVHVVVCWWPHPVGWRSFTEALCCLGTVMLHCPLNCNFLLYLHTSPSWGSFQYFRLEWSVSIWIMESIVK
jgi:hypothetical protein